MHWLSLNWVDILLGTAILAMIPFALAAYGGHLAAETIADPRKKRKAKLAFWGMFALGIALVFWQQIRGASSDLDRDIKTVWSEGMLLKYLNRPPTPPAFAYLSTNKLDTVPRRGAPAFSIQAITNAPNSAAVGINTGTVTITSAIPIRSLSESQKQSIAVFLSGLPSTLEVNIGSVYGSGDANLYAGEFLRLLADSHKTKLTAPPIRTGFPVEFTGVFVATNSDTDVAVPHRDEFVKFLKGLGIPANRAKGREIPAGTLYLLVGYRPEEVKQQ